MYIPFLLSATLHEGPCAHRSSCVLHPFSHVCFTSSCLWITFTCYTVSSHICSSSQFFHRGSRKVWPYFLLMEWAYFIKAECKSQIKRTFLFWEGREGRCRDNSATWQLCTHYWGSSVVRIRSLISENVFTSAPHSLKIVAAKKWHSNPWADHILTNQKT